MEVILKIVVSVTQTLEICVETLVDDKEHFKNIYSWGKTDKFFFKKASSFLIGEGKTGNSRKQWKDSKIIIVKTRHKRKITVV